MTKATGTAQVTKAIRKAGFPVDCVKGCGYVYFMSDDLREVDSIYVCYLKELSVENYVSHVADFFK